MGYQTIKDGIGTMLRAKGFNESSDVFNFSSESDQSTHKRYRVTRNEFAIEGAGTEYISVLVRPKFTFTLALGFKISAERALFDYDVAQNLIDTVIAYFNNPASYSGYAIMMKTTKGGLEMVKDHMEALITLEVHDDIALA